MNKIQPYKVGITGGIGAGKTMVSKVFRVLGIPLYNADDRAKWLMAHDEPLRNVICSEFGKEAYHQDGSLNRGFLASKVFSDPVKTEKINALVHPRVGADFLEWHQKQSAPYVLKEAALLFETGSYKALDKIILVTAPLSIRLKRVLERDPHRTEAQVMDIVEKQWDEARKIELADFILDNSGDSLLIPKILALHQELITTSEEGTPRNLPS
jgi:dephospho-CoA kinase